MQSQKFDGNIKADPSIYCGGSAFYDKRVVYAVAGNPSNLKANNFAVRL